MSLSIHGVPQKPGGFPVNNGEFNLDGRHNGELDNPMTSSR